MKTYADSCLERAEKATPGTWTIDFKEPNWFGIESDKDSGDWVVCGDESEFPRPTKVNAEFIAHSRQMVPELAKRLKRACEFIRVHVPNMIPIGMSGYTEFRDLCLKQADELERMPGDPKAPDDQL